MEEGLQLSSSEQTPLQTARGEAVEEEDIIRWDCHTKERVHLEDTGLAPDKNGLTGVRPFLSGRHPNKAGKKSFEYLVMKTKRYFEILRRAMISIYDFASESAIKTVQHDVDVT